MTQSASLAPANGELELSGPPRLLVAWQHPHSRRITLVGLLERTADRYVFQYLPAALDTPDFRPFLGFEDLHGRYVADQLFPLFRQRIMDHKRPDFNSYLEMLDLDRGSSSMAQLARSGGSRAGDSVFLLAEPEVADDGTTRATFFVHGVRYQQGAAYRIAQLEAGEQVALRCEPENEFNSLAVLVTSGDDQVLGWVPDVLTEYVQYAMSMGTPSVRVNKVNGADTPPNLRLLVRLVGQLPPGYRPFSEHIHEPLA